tara:strand:- start:2189 stop:3103 length:915 start_codon:yes stop_codon:yes gene_type:complete
MVKKKLRVAVIGLGYLGKYHLEKYLKNRNVAVKWVIDSDINNLKLNINESIKKSTDFEDIIGNVDCASIVTPTTSHFQIAKSLLQNKINILLEKPMTESLSQAKKLNAMVKGKKVIMQVGHLERFNPVVEKLTSEINNPLFIEVHRLAKFNPRSTDVNVIFDLMIHDIDIILSLVESPIKKISVFGKKIITQTTDIANVRIEFLNHSVANLTASRISAKNERKIRIFEKNKYYSVDFLLSKMNIFSKKTNRIFKQNEFSYKKADALKKEINNFVNSCLGHEKPLVDGINGMNALKVAEDISRKL